MKIFHGESKLPFFVETPPAKQFKSQEPCHTQACEMIYAGGYTLLAFTGRINIMWWQDYDKNMSPADYR